MPPRRRVLAHPCLGTPAGIERHDSTDPGTEQRGRVLVEDDLAGRLPPAAGRDGHPVDGVVRRGPPGHDLVADQIALPCHAGDAATGHGPALEVTPPAAAVAASCASLTAAS